MESRAKVEKGTVESRAKIGKGTEESGAEVGTNLIPLQADVRRMHGWKDYTKKTGICCQYCKQ